MAYDHACGAVLPTWWTSFVRKGTQIYIEGRLRTREWMDKDNNKRYTTEILADVMNLLGPPHATIPSSDGQLRLRLASRRHSPQGASSGQQGGLSAAGYPVRPAAPQPQPAAPSIPGRRSGRPAFLIFDL